MEPRSVQIGIHVALVISLLDCCISQSVSINSGESGASGEVPCSTTVARPPKIIVQPDKEIIFNAGDNQRIDLPCKAVGVPEPRYQWYINDVALDLNTHKNIKWTGLNGSLIMFATYSDQGDYRCVAENPCGKSLSHIVQLKRTSLGSFPSQDKTARALQEGEYVKLPCRGKPRSIPNGMIKWSLVTEDYRSKPLTLNERIQIDGDGNLHFAYVTQEDSSKDGYYYRCSVYNNFMNSERFGGPYELQIMPDSTATYPLKLVYKTEDMTVALKGDTVTLQCIFSGRPVPKVVWTRKLHGEEEELPSDRAVISNGGSTLTISSLEEDDDGEYTCTLSDISERIILKIESAPSWNPRRGAPRDVVKFVGDYAAYQCDAIGTPKPDLTFYHNGELQRNMPLGNVFIIEAVTKEDMMTVQCNVSNKHGYVFANIAIIVLEPTVVEDLEDQYITTSVSDNGVSFSCVATGDPAVKFKYEWFYLNQKGQKERVTLDGPYAIQGGKLLLDVKKEDIDKLPNVFMCVVSTIFDGREVHSTEKRAALMKVLRVAQEASNISSGDRVTLTCHGKGYPTPKFRWRQNGKVLPDEQQDVKDGTSTLVIDNAGSEYSGNYTCEVYNERERVESSGLLVKMSDKGLGVNGDTSSSSMCVISHLLLWMCVLIIGKINV